MTADRLTHAKDLAEALIGNNVTPHAARTCARGIIDAIEKREWDRLTVYVTVLLECPGKAVHRVAEDIARTIGGGVKA